MNKLTRHIARIVLVAFLWQAIIPATSLFALTGGPSQPEFSGFEPVSSSNMVSPLTGQFTYNLPVLNVPGPNGSGYAMSLSYHAGVSPEEEASWVGYGWTLNPGSISRTKRGFPDENNGTKVRYWNKQPAHYTVTASVFVQPEFFSQIPEYATSASINASYRYDSHKGSTVAAGIRADVSGYGTLDFSVSGGEASFTATISPAKILNEPWLNLNELQKTITDASSRAVYDGLTALGMQEALAGTLASTGGPAIMQYAQYSVSRDIRPTHITPYTGISTEVNISVLPTSSFLPIALAYGTGGSYTWQKSTDVMDEKTYGYLYSGNVGDEGVMDYYAEKEAPFETRDAFLSIPFSNADYFNVSGEGLAGGFRAYNKKPGQFRMNPAVSNTVIFKTGGQVHYPEKPNPLDPTPGWHVGLGTTIAGGYHRQSQLPWIDEGSTWKFATADEGDEPFFFRMNNDLGGDVLFADNDNAFQADISQVTRKPAVSLANVGMMNDGQRSGRSSYISYSTAGELRKVKKYGLNRAELSVLEDYDFPAYNYIDDLPDEAVAEIGVTTPGGMKYAYGMPIVSRNEKSLQFGLKDLAHTKDLDQNLVYASVVPETAPVVLGEETLTPYVGQYLLTSIVSPDYIDRTHNGYTNDDFGGWTKFVYTSTDIYRIRVKTKTPQHSWYKWRVPYRGLNYSKGLLSDDKDDMGTVSMGERELVYLTSIETKSHVAVFITNNITVRPTKSIAKSYGLEGHRDWKYHYPDQGSGTSGSGIIHFRREDSYMASPLETISAGDNTSTTASNSMGEQLGNPVQQLERIELWSKDENGQLKEKIQTVRFEYNNSLCQGLPNSYDGAGKLTLKRVYFEYNGVVNAKISPYVFGYEYKKESKGDYDGLQDEVQDKYKSIIEYAEGLTDDSEVTPGNESEQNPNYQHYHIGRWGYYQPNGQSRFKDMVPWEDQNPDPASYDPAAWNLKWIRLPSGGEIHIQYEQNTYGFVQDQPAMIMARLAHGEINITNDRFYLDLKSTLGLDPGSTDPVKAAADAETVAKLRNAIADRNETKGDKMFFKILHTINGDDANASNNDVVDIGINEVEYITGYGSISNVGIDPTTHEIWVEFSSGSYSTPSKAARDFVQKNLGKSLRTNPLGFADDAVGFVMSLIGSIAGIEDDAVNLLNLGDNDADIDYDNSWVRIPIGTPNEVVVPKRGGGVRVKRVLMYDPGMTGTGEGHLFGTEYLYETEEGWTSGVATNEPASGKEENSLVRLLDKRADQNWLEKLIAGRDKDQYEGPLGESLLPGPSVAYSRVVAKNIHSGRTNPGFTIHEHYTAKDFPSQCIYSKEQIDNKRVTQIQHDNSIPVIFPGPYVSIFRSHLRATQGYSFVMNNMHGQMKKVATYGGNYDDPPSEWAESSSQEYYYFNPGDQIPVMTGYKTSGNVMYDDLGKEMEVVFEGRTIKDESIDVTGFVDVGLSWMVTVPPVVSPFLSGSGNIAVNDRQLNTHVTTKVVRYPAIVKEVISREDGIEHRTQNLAFSPLTGQPLLTQTTDGYTGQNLEYSNGVAAGAGGAHDRVYRSFSYPAAEEYPEMGQKASNEGRFIGPTTGVVIIKRFYDGKHYLSLSFTDPKATCDASELFTPGDLVRLQLYPDQLGNDWPDYFSNYNVESVFGNRVIIQPHSNTSYIYPYMFNNLLFNATIIRSGKTNQLAVPRAGITTYAPDVGP